MKAAAHSTSSVPPLVDKAAVQAVQSSSEGAEATLRKASSLAYSGAPPNRSDPLTPTAVVHDQEWFEEQVTIPIGGPVIRRPWSVRGLQGDVITESTDFSVTPYDYFLAMFP
jgi:hypothetical protein